MIDSITAWLMAFSFTSYMGIGLYWLPLSVCAYGYTVRTWLNYQKDVKAREKAETEGKGYTPTDTVGTLIGRAIVSITPIANLWAGAFDVAPRLFSSFFGWLGRIFDQPLVPKKRA